MLSPTLIRADTSVAFECNRRSRLRRRAVPSIHTSQASGTYLPIVVDGADSKDQYSLCSMVLDQTVNKYIGFAVSTLPKTVHSLLRCDLDILVLRVSYPGSRVVVACRDPVASSV